LWTRGEEDRSLEVQFRIGELFARRAFEFELLHLLERDVQDAAEFFGAQAA